MAILILILISYLNMANKPSIDDKIAGDLATHSDFNTVKNYFENKVDVDGVKVLSDENFTAAFKAILDTIDPAQLMRTIVHLGDPDVAKPAGYGPTTWTGWVEPNNWDDYDIWYVIAGPESLPTISGSGTFTAVGSPRTYTIDLGDALEGNLMIIAFYNSGTDTAYTPPAGWDVVTSAYGMDIYARVKEAGDADTFVFTSNQNTANGVASLYIAGVDYTDTSSLTIGVQTAVSSDTGKTIGGLTLSKSALVLAFITGSNAIPNSINNGFAVYQSFPEPSSAFRYMNVYQKDNTELTTGTVAYTFSGAASNTGVLIGIYS